MSSALDDPAGRRRRDHGAAVFAVVSLALAAGYVAWTWSDGLASLDGDNAYYVLLARDFSPFGDTVVPHAEGRRAPYPPLYPLLLAFTGGADSLRAAHAITALAMAAAFAALAAWSSAAGLPRAVSLVLTVAVALMPGVYLDALELHSEPLFLLWVLLALRAGAGVHQSRSRGRWWACALAIGAAGLTRSAGVSLGAAFVVVLLVRRPRGALALAALALGPGLAWLLTGAGGDASYLDDFVARYAAPGGSGLVETLAGQALALVTGWEAVFTHGLASVWPARAVLALGMLAALVRAMRAELDGLFTLAYVAMVWLWPYPAEAERLMLVAVPVLLAQALLGVCAAIDRTRLAAGMRDVILVGALCAVLTASLPALAFTAQRFALPAPAALGDLRRTVAWYLVDPAHFPINSYVTSAIARGLKRGRGLLADDDARCVLAVKPSIVTLLTGVAGVAPPAPASSDEAFDAEIARAGCRHAFLIVNATPSFPSMYPIERIRDRMAVLDVAGYETGHAGLANVVGVLARIEPSGGTR